MKVSKVAQSVEASVTMAVTARAKELKVQGVDVVSFGAGEPDFDTPEFIKQAAKQALDQGATKYSPAAGNMQLRQEISRKLKEENGLEYKPSQIAVTCGAKHAVYEAIHAVVDPGDEVLIPAPFWVSYPEMVNLVGGIPKTIPTGAETDYKLTPELLRGAITARSCLLILNYPNNPGGFCYSPDELAALGEVIAETDLAVISDEIYEKLIYGDMVFRSFAAVCPDLYERVITINGLSKAYSMTGWRVGYTAAPDDVAQAISRMQSHMTSGPATFCQLASIEALAKGQAEIEKMHAEFSKRAEHIYKRLNALDGVMCPRPTGAFYAFPNVASHYGRLKVAGSVAFCQRLLEEARVACVPGVGFGCDENIRMSFATSMEQIDKGIDRLAEFLNTAG
ncbi:MAG: pyridoxal phosphate-dependent aminotransferase [Sedimentisphaerales bacterium]|nr:pyridoxal phosphate-dependent aminotransferase [Sedimentisphaerales bacterium]